MTFLYAVCSVLIAAGHPYPYCTQPMPLHQASAYARHMNRAAPGEGDHTLHPIPAREPMRSLWIASLPDSGRAAPVK